MINNLAVSILLLAFFASVSFNGFFRSIAKKNKLLIDIPDKSRKFHFRATPLTGGLGIFFGILVSAILISGLTDANYSVDLSKKGFLESSQLQDRPVSKNFEVGNKQYSLSLNKKSNAKISVEIQSDEDSNIVDIVPIAEDKFKAILPNGDEKVYFIDSGDVIEISSSNQTVDIFSPKNTDNINLNNFTISLYICALFIMLFMVLDDFYNIKPVIRLCFQFLISGLMIAMSGEYLGNLGNLFGTGVIDLGIFSIPFTILCVVGIMNAFNMIDGLNGICASLALIPIAYVTYLGNFSYGLLIPIGAILGFLAYNLGYLGKKRRVFLGDSGSNMLGFAVAFICIEYSQDISHLSYINPVTALWLVFIPLVDCIAVVTVRLINGITPFTPGRDHLHHRLLNMDIKPKKILIIFILLAVFLSLIGFTIELFYPNKEYISFFTFCAFATFYFLISNSGRSKNV
tara:strand:+ start:73 stop:1446 length:1374 start_codon:yes stop_codon:yes gene_type:complete